jgi:hypothetical protein
MKIEFRRNRAISADDIINQLEQAQWTAFRPELNVEKRTNQQKAPRKSSNSDLPLNTTHSPNVVHINSAHRISRAALDLLPIQCPAQPDSPQLQRNLCRASPDRDLRLRQQLQHLLPKAVRRWTPGGELRGVHCQVCTLCPMSIGALGPFVGILRALLSMFLHSRKGTKIIHC